MERCAANRRLAHAFSALGCPAAATADEVPATALDPPFLPRPAHDWRIDPPTSIVTHRQLTAGEKEAWQRDGYVLLQDFLTPAQLKRWRVCVDSAVEERQGASFPGDERTGDRNGAFYSSVFDQTLNLHQTNRDMRGELHHIPRFILRFCGFWILCDVKMYFR